jgi:hypothetical protein
MTNFDINIEHIVSSQLNVKASGSIVDQAKEDLILPEGDSIEVLLGNEKNIK